MTGGRVANPGYFLTDTDVLRWYGTRCADIGREVEALNRRTFDSDAALDDRVWGGKMMCLTGLGSSLERLSAAYERARAATAARTAAIALQLDITDVNVRRVANDYDAADQRAADRQPR